MSTETLSSLTQETVQIYARTAKTLVKTYRAGVHRAVGGFRTRLGSAAGAVKIEQPVKKSILNAGQQLATLIATRVDALSSAANHAIDVVAKGSSKALGTAAVGADRLYGAFPSRATEFFGQINLPAMRLSRDLAAQISSGAERIATRVGGKGAVAKAVAKPARRTSKKVSPAKKVSRPVARGSKRARKA